MLVRHSAATPRRGCFLGYLDDAGATEAAWRGGWFHTGDMVWRGADGMLHFVDRKKNIIRRSGENIAAAEVEALLLTHPNVLQAAVMPVEDELREEEVLACIVLKRALPVEEAAKALFQHCFERLAYYKAPGWVHIVDSLPTTGTQKIQKHAIYPKGTDPARFWCRTPAPEAASKGLTLSCMLFPQSWSAHGKSGRARSMPRSSISSAACRAECRPIGRACRSG